MSDDEADQELLELLRQSLGIGAAKSDLKETKVLEGAEHVYDNSIDVALVSQNTKAAAHLIWTQMQQRDYTNKTWSSHALHPQSKDESTVDFIFTMDLLNYCFWSERGPEERFAVEYQGARYTGYWSLVAALRRALDEGIPVTSSDFWQNEDECSRETIQHIFRSATEEQIPLLDERLECLREAGNVLYNRFQCRFANCVREAGGSAAGLVNLLCDHFACLRDEFKFEGKKVRFLKRAQLIIADLWACFEGTSFGEFHDIDKITMFADYRVPQMLHMLGCLSYSPKLESQIKTLEPIESGHPWEIQLRGCTIWCVELIRREIRRHHPESEVNAILIDFFLYDFMKEQEASEVLVLPHHRTRSIWY